MIQNAYIEMHNGSKSVTVVVRNGMAYPQTLKIPVGRVVAANQMLEAWMWPGMVDMMDEVQGIQTLRITMEQRQEKLFQKLESCELSCTHLTEHVIKVTDDGPFKEWFRWIPKPLVEEVCAHL